MVVKLYASDDVNGTAVFEESFNNLEVVNGFLTVAIGQREDVAAVLWKYNSLFYDMIIDGKSIFNDKLQPVTASPYSLKTAVNLHGQGAPNAAITAPIGATYVDTQNRLLYIKVGSADNDWVQVGH